MQDFININIRDQNREGYIATESWELIFGGC